MTSIFSVGFQRIRPAGALTRLCKIQRTYNVTQVAFMKRLAMLEKRAKPPPYPYWEKSCSALNMVGDLTSLRYDENSRLIVVDGLPAIGKTKFCKRLAEEFGLLYMPAPVHDEIYTNPYGYDVRNLDPQLPEGIRSYDLKAFLANPEHDQVPHFQLQYFAMKLEQYLNALLHILATGQGVILNRCVLSDICFVHAMYRSGYLTKVEMKEFHEMRTNMLEYIFFPHLIIYLDASTETAHHKIKKRGNADELNSKVLSARYLADLDRALKDIYLATSAAHSEILVYDWTNEGNYEDVIFDIESLDLESDDNKKKLHDWVFLTTEDIVMNMSLFQQKKTIYDNVFYGIGDVRAPRLWLHPKEAGKMERTLRASKEEGYKPGFNPFYGEKTMFRREEKAEPLCLIRRTPRDLINYDLVNAAS